MNSWKEIPPWFKLDNYSDLANFSAKEWLSEIFARYYYSDSLTNPDQYCDVDNNQNSEDIKEIAEDALKFFDTIKKQPLFYKENSIIIPELQPIDEKLKILVDKCKQHNFASVTELSEYTAYSFFLNSSKRSEIENDYLHSSYLTGNEDCVKEIARNIEVQIKYSNPIADLEDEEFDYKKFLEVNLLASNEQILNEFKDWLINTRNHSINPKSLKRQFSPQDFQDWRSSKILPYWDLTNIAMIQKTAIPFHVLGKALFPDEYDIDLTERIRKTTKRKCQFIFSEEVISALMLQVCSEELQRK